MTTKSAKHANKTFGSAKDKSAKAVDMRTKWLLFRLVLLA